MPRPEPGPGDVLVQIEVALTDGTDLKTFRRGHPLLARESPAPFGHEFCGHRRRAPRGRRELRAVRRVRRLRARRAVPRRSCSSPAPTRTGSSSPSGSPRSTCTTVPPAHRARGRGDGRAARVLPARRRARRGRRPATRVAILGAGPIGLMLAACVADAGGWPVVVGGRDGAAGADRAFGAETGDGRRRRRRDRGGGQRTAWTGRNRARAPGRDGRHVRRPPARRAPAGRRLPPPLRGADGARLVPPHAGDRARGARASSRAAPIRGSGSSRTACCSTTCRRSSPIRRATCSRPPSLRDAAGAEPHAAPAAAAARAQADLGAEGGGEARRAAGAVRAVAVRRAVVARRGLSQGAADDEPRRDRQGGLASARRCTSSTREEFPCVASSYIESQRGRTEGLGVDIEALRAGDPGRADRRARELIELAARVLGTDDRWTISFASARSRSCAPRRVGPWPHTKPSPVVLWREPLPDAAGELRRASSAQYLAAYGPATRDDVVQFTGFKLAPDRRRRSSGCARSRTRQGGALRPAARTARRRARQGARAVPAGVRLDHPRAPRPRADRPARVRRRRSSTRRTRRRRTRSPSTVSSPAPGASRRSSPSSRSHRCPARVAARGRCRGRAAARLVPRLDDYTAKSVSSGSRSPRSTARSTSTQSMPRCSASAIACGLICCATRIAAAGGARRVGADAVEVARELLDRVDRPDALDLDRDPAVVLVAAHQVDRADVGRPLALHEPEARRRCASGRRRAAAAGRARRRPSRAPAASPMSCVTSESTSTSLISSRSSLRPARLRTTTSVAAVLDHRRRRHPVQAACSRRRPRARARSRRPSASGAGSTPAGTRSGGRSR